MPHSASRSLRRDWRAAPSGDDVTCDQAGTPLRTPTGAFVAAGQGYDAVYNRTNTSTLGYGASLQLTVKEPVFEHANHFVAGASYDGARSDFTQATELAFLTLDRGTLAGAGAHSYSAGDATGGSDEAARFTDR